MNLTARPTTLEAIAGWRDFYRAEMNCQIIHDSIHSRPGWSLEYELQIDGEPAGYGSIAIAGPWKENPTIYELFVVSEKRNRVFDLFTNLARASGARRVETQSNDVLLTTMLHTFGENVECESILHHDKLTTHFAPPGAVFREAKPGDSLDLPPEKLWSHGVVEVEGLTAAKGGILFHYNKPYGDIYMETIEPFRRRGLGSYLVQELKRVCRAHDCIPSARCNRSNSNSRKTLQKAGFVPCGNLLVASLKW
jgi:GNAT superfamily N-acetyltransferase